MTATGPFSLKLAQVEEQLAVKAAEAAKLRDSVEFLFGLLEQAKIERDQQLGEIKNLNMTMKEKETMIGDLEQKQKLQEAAFRKILGVERNGFEKRLSNLKKLISDRENLLCLWVEGSIKSSKTGNTMDPLVTHLIEKTSSNIESSRQSAIEAFKFTSKASNSVTTEETEAESKAFLVKLKKLKFSKYSGRLDGRTIKKKGSKRSKMKSDDVDLDHNDNDDDDDYDIEDGGDGEDNDGLENKPPITTEDKEKTSFFDKTRSMFSFVSPKQQRKPSVKSNVSSSPNRKASSTSSNRRASAATAQHKVVLKYDPPLAQGTSALGRDDGNSPTTTNQSPKTKSLLNTFLSSVKGKE